MEGIKALAEAIKVHVSALRFDWYHFELDLTSGSTAVVYGYSYYNTTKGALSNVNILSNNIGTEQASQLIKIMANKPKLKTLCGFSGNETELDLSYEGLSTGCGVLVGNEVKNNGALTSLNISANKLEGYEDLDTGEWISDMTGIQALAAAIPQCK
jgi:hypothetical protein